MTVGTSAIAAAASVFAADARRAPRRRGAPARRPPRPVIASTSMPPLRGRARRAASLAASRQRGRAGLPTTMRVTLRSRAYARISSATLWPAQRDGPAAEPLGQLERAGQLLALRWRRAAGRRASPRAPRPSRRAAAPPCAASRGPAGRPGARPDAHQQPLRRRPRSPGSPAPPCSRASARPPARRCGAARARGARSGFPCGRTARSRARPARGRRPCPREAAAAACRAGGPRARSRRRAR